MIIHRSRFTMFQFRRLSHFTLITSALMTSTLLATPALADTITGEARVAKVTLYPAGALVTRRVELTAAPGTHEIVLPGLPEDIDPDSLRIAATGATVGSVSLQQGRALPDEAPDSPAVIAAREDVFAKERTLRERDARTANIRAEAEAANDTIAFLMKLAEAEGAAQDDVATLAASVQAQILDARRKAIAAEDAARNSTQGREEEVKALDAARAKLEALENPQSQGETLVIAVQVGEGGDGSQPAAPFSLDITSGTDMAEWRPVYDLRLDRASGTMVMERGVVVGQGSGEDWENVTLTLSTARPGEQSSATEVTPDFPRTEPEMDEFARGRSSAAEADMAYAEAAPTVEVEAVVVDEMSATDMGLTMSYDYPAPVTIRDGVDALRLKLDEKRLTPEIFAEAAPRFDTTAYLMAEGTNTIDEPILPGRAMMFADGVLVGQTDLQFIAEGDEIRLGFGPIDGILVERRVPEREEGQGGLIRRSNEENETATLRIENLTDEEWPLRVVDRVPVSQQEDLTVEWSADPEPSETDPDGRRGVLYWESELAAGEVKEITVTTELRWPDGNILLR